MKTSKKRLLLLGGINLSCEIVETAKEMGVYTIVTDYLETSPAKKYADESQMISTTDINAVVKFCKENNIDGVFTNFIDSLLPYCCEICNQLNMPFYLTEQQIHDYAIKDNFKAVCDVNNVATPKKYELDENNNPVGSVEFPVIVKPVDSSGSKGITVCKNKMELQNAIANALSYSRSKKVIAEKYFSGDEITANYVMKDGEIKLSCLHDRYFNTEQEGVLKVPDVYIYPSKYTNMYLKNVNDRVISMLKKSKYCNGSLFMQACVEDNEVYFYETGTRLNGCKIYHIIESETGFSALRGMINYSLTGKMGFDDEFKKIEPSLKHWYATLSILSKPGKIGKIVGLKQIKKMQSVIDVTQWYWEGDEIKPEYMGTLLQTLARITIKSDNKNELFSAIEKVYNLIKCFNADGEYMLLNKHNLNNLRKQVDYEI